MQRKNVSFEQLADVMAFRVLVDEVGDCYHALGIIHSAYHVVPGRFKDYISTPKPNNYRSLHTGVIGPERQRIEVQIRTRDMHEVAELGVAAHWIYKQQAGSVDGRQYRWLRELLEILDHASNPEEFLEHTKLEMFQDQVFAFTPKGDLIALPRGATPVDFAYAVHSQIGDTCVGAKINGRLLPLRTELANGDQVEIVTSKAQTPSPTWERFVVTGKARARIRRFVRTQQRAQYLDLGRAIVQKAFRQHGQEFSERPLEAVLRTVQLRRGRGSLRRGRRRARHRPRGGQRRLPAAARATRTRSSRWRAPARRDKRTIPRCRSAASSPGWRCISPAAATRCRGDRIVGIVTTGKGVTIHTIDCDTLESFADEPERWLDVAWSSDEADAAHVGRINVTIANEPGNLGSLTTTIGKQGGNISNLKITNRSTDFFEIMVDIQVADVKHLTTIIAALRATPVINSVERARG